MGLQTNWWVVTSNGRLGGWGTWELQGAILRKPLYWPCEAIGRTGGLMTFWKFFSRKAEPKQRVRVCIECGMPIAEHKEWCSILRTQQERERKAAPVQPKAAVQQ
jgi:hypothetical protein